MQLRSLFSLVLVGFVSLSTHAKVQGVAVATEDLKVQLKALQDSVNRLESDVKELKNQNGILMKRTAMSFHNQTYGRGGFSLNLPRERTFPFASDTGLGLFVGIGQYFGNNHVAEFTFEWDFYPSLVLRYRYEFHYDSPALTFGPVVGYKVKAASVRPIDNFLEKPEEVKSSFFLIGAMIGFPLTRGLITLELTYLVNQQSFLAANTGITFFL